jgi:hypothetical protein
MIPKKSRLRVWFRHTSCGKIVRQLRMNLRRWDQAVEKFARTNPIAYGQWVDRMNSDW